MAYFKARVGGSSKIKNFATGLLAANINKNQLPTDYEVYLGFRPTRIYISTFTGSNQYDMHWVYTGDAVVTRGGWLTGYNVGLAESIAIPNSAQIIGEITDTGFKIGSGVSLDSMSLRYIAIEDDTDSSVGSRIEYISGKFLQNTVKTIETSNAVIFLQNRKEGFGYNRPGGGGTSNNVVYTVIDGVLTEQFKNASQLPTVTYSNGILSMVNTNNDDYTYCILYESGKAEKLSGSTYSYGQVAGNAEKSFNITNGYLICSNRANVGTSGNTTDLGVGETYYMKDGHIYPLWRYNSSSRSMDVLSYTNGVLTIKNANSSACSYIIYGK